MSHAASATTIFIVVVTSGCVSRQLLAEAAGDYGWSQVDARGAPAVDQTSLDRLESVALDSGSPTCEQLQARVNLASGAPVLVMVHGIGAGDGPEWDNAMSILMNALPAAAFMFKWVSYEARHLMVRRLAAGINRLAHCTKHRILVFAHSAGGILSAYAASQLAPTPGVELDLVTVAAPLAGAMARTAAADGELMYLLELGSRIKRYPPSAQGVRVWHLRTRFPADKVMKPGSDGLSANELSVGVPGARQYTLPAQLSHVAALTYVARRIARENWLGWLEAANPPPPEFLLDARSK